MDTDTGGCSRETNRGEWLRVDWLFALVHSRTLAAAGMDWFTRSPGSVWICVHYLRADWMRSAMAMAVRP